LQNIGCFHKISNYFCNPSYSIVSGKRIPSSPLEQAKVRNTVSISKAKYKQKGWGKAKWGKLHSICEDLSSICNIVGGSGGVSDQKTSKFLFCTGKNPWQDTWI
jgi:hypothetical protein